MSFFKFSDNLTRFSVILFLGISSQLVTVHCEEVLFNGTHRLNQTMIEVTTVKIAEIVNLRVNSANTTTIIVKEKTAKHFAKSTLSPKVVLIPPAKVGAQIVASKAKAIGVS